MSSKPLLSADLGFFAQRLYKVRRRAQARVSPRLSSTAYTILPAAHQSTILSAIKDELRTQAEIIMRRLSVREKFPYDDTVEAAISKVFYENLQLFRIGDEDDSTVEELLYYEF